MIFEKDFRNFVWINDFDLEVLLEKKFKKQCYRLKARNYNSWTENTI
jgi:hypothetical protein